MLTFANIRGVSPESCSQHRHLHVKSLSKCYPFCNAVPVTWAPIISSQIISYS